MKEIGVGLVGYGFMGKAHSNAYAVVSKFFNLDAKPRMKIICGLVADEAKEAAERFGWELSTDKWQDVVKRDDVQLVDISAPSIVHKEVAVAAAKAGKHIFCEKPLAFTAEEGVEMVKAARAAKVKNFIGFSYRRCPAIGLAKQLVDGGLLGKVHHVRATYLQDWLVDPKFPMNWRLRKKQAGSGAHGDLGAHLVDMARYLVGDIKEVIGMNETFIKERPAEGKAVGLTATAGKGTEKVDVDDATLFLCRFENGALGSFEATRFATGRKNFNRIEINGSEGSLYWCFEEMNELYVYSRKDPENARGFKKILATEGVHPYAGRWWPPGHVLGYENCFVNEVADMIDAITKDKPIEPDFMDGLKVQCVLDAVDRSIEKRAWEKVTVPKV